MKNKNENGKASLLSLLAIGTILTLTILGAQTVRKDLVVDGNGTLVAPTNFWTTNAPAITNAIGSHFATAAQGSLASSALQVGTSWTNISGLGTAATNTASAFTAASHATNTNNPHSVTKSQVGLGSVENTALSTWAGSTNITSVGTITNGTWSGNAMATNKLPNITLNLTGLLHNTPVVITNGVGTASLATQAANTVLSGPTTGTNAVPAFRALVSADLPAASGSQAGAVTTGTQTLAGAKTFSGDVSVQGNTTLGDASGDVVTINGNARGSNQTAAYVDSYLTRDLVDARISLQGPWVTALSFYNGTAAVASSGAATALGSSVILATTSSTSSTATYSQNNPVALVSAGASNTYQSGGTWWDVTKSHTLAFIFCPPANSTIDDVITRVALGSMTAISTGMQGLPTAGYSLRISKKDASNYDYRVTLAFDWHPITAASNASPIVITKTAHGLTNGATIEITGVVGNTAANGFWTVANVTADTFELSGSTGNGAWSSGGNANIVSAPVTVPSHTAQRIFLSWSASGTQGTIALRLGSPANAVSASAVGWNAVNNVMPISSYTIGFGQSAVSTTAYAVSSFSAVTIIQQ